MKKKELQEFKAKPTPELEKVLREKRDHFVELKFNIATGKVKSLKEYAEVRKTIAQIETILRGREE